MLKDLEEEREKEREKKIIESRDIEKKSKNTEREKKVRQERRLHFW